MGADVINMSWGGYTSLSNSGDLRRAINYAYENDVILVASAGNKGMEVREADFGLHTDTHYPSSYTRVLAVGSTTVDDARASLSNYGDEVIYAPGEEIYTTEMSGGYTEDCTGTSCAAAPGPCPGRLESRQ